MALPEGVGDRLKHSIPNLFFPESQAIVFPTLPQGLTRNLFCAPDSVFPPSIFLPPLPNPFANDITCLHIVTCRLPTHLSSVCSSSQACPVLPAPLFLLTQGKVCVCEPGREDGSLPQHRQPGRAARAGQLGRHNYTGRLTAPPPRLAVTDDLAGTAALGLPTDIS